MVVVGGLVVVTGGLVVVVGALVDEGRVVVAGGFVVAGARVEVVFVVAACLVLFGACAVVVDVLSVVGSVVHSGHAVLLSSSVVESSHSVVSSVTMVVSGSVGSSWGGDRKRLVKMNVSRIAARNRPMKIAVRLSFLFFRLASPPSQLYYTVPAISSRNADIQGFAALQRRAHPQSVIQPWKHSQ